MRQKYTIDEKEKLLDLIVEIAMIVHESGIQIAEKLEIPEQLIFDLRDRSPRAAMISPCNCQDCIYPHG